MLGTIISVSVIIDGRPLLFLYELRHRITMKYVTPEIYCFERFLGGDWNVLKGSFIYIYHRDTEGTERS